MSHLVSRILLSIFMFPLAGIFYLVVWVIGKATLRNSGLSYNFQDMGLFMGSAILTWLVVAGYWCMLWRTGVQWNGARVVRTFLSAGAALVVGAIVGAMVAAAMSYDGASFGTFVGGVLAIILWLIATVFVWRETTAERSQRLSASLQSAITCPTCGYNLTGLSETRCPECGSRFTLNELIALQPGVEVEID